MQTTTAHRTAAQYALNIVRAYGFVRLYRGLAVTALRDVPTYGIWFVVYELSTREFGKSAAVQIAGGAAAGALSWLVAFPIDVIKTVIQSAPIADPQTTTIRAALSNVVSKGGLSHLYRGCTLTAIRGALVAAVTFIVYDAVRLTIKPTR